MKLYAIRKGRTNNIIVDSWDKASDLVTGFNGAEYKSFTDRRDAQKYLDDAKETILNSDRVIFCEANCEMKVDKKCTSKTVKINKDGQCLNY